MARNNKVYFRVSDEELQSLQGKAGDAGVSEWARDLLLYGEKNTVANVGIADLQDWELIASHILQKEPNFIDKIADKSKSRSSHEKWAQCIIDGVFPPKPTLSKWFTSWVFCPSVEFKDKPCYDNDSNTYGIRVRHPSSGFEKWITSEDPDWRDALDFFNINYNPEDFGWEE